MYKRVYLYIGLPGSGKTHHANRTCDVVVDDIVDIANLPTEEELGGRTLGITDVNFCDDKILHTATERLREVYPLRFQVLCYFENDPDACRSNVEYRDDGRLVEGTIRRFAETYKPPTYANPVWKNPDFASK